MSTIPSERQTLAKTLGQIWGLLALAALFGMGGYRLLNKAYSLTYLQTEGIPLTAFDWFLYGLIILLGVGKAYAIFYRKMVPRTLARCRTALGETGWSMDYLLAPFCMLSLYRPWKKKHAILSWIVIPVMVLLAVSFVLWVPDSVFKAAVDWAVGGALAFAALLYIVALVRLLGWLAMGAKFEQHPFPVSAD
ncbi:MAG: hypothetical protein JNJ77_03310 [Planctomycetia bacterium]|nr:hypothetical protein [Planctomycetia bacterium]